jgi:hypothetical protein
MIRLKHILLVGVCLSLTQLNVLSGPLSRKQINVNFYLTEGPYVIYEEDGRIKQEPGTRTLFVYITNKTTQAIRIPTEMLRLEYKEMGSHFNILIKWDHPYRPSKLNFIIPESKIGIVELREDESVGLAFNIEKKWPSIDKQIQVSMEIPHKIWERYKLDYFDFLITR